MKNINEMNLIEVENEIANIQNDYRYFEADMADRLQGEEQKWYEEQTNRLFELHNRRTELKKITKDYWYDVINTQTKLITKWNEELLNNPSTFKKIELNKNIEEAEATIENAIAELKNII